jgi:hypothetical protein
MHCKLVHLPATSTLVSISPTFYEQLLRQNPFAKKLQTQNCEHIKELRKKLLYEKAAHKILVKLTPDLIFVSKAGMTRVSYIKPTMGRLPQ